LFGLTFVLVVLGVYFFSNALVVPWRNPKLWNVNRIDNLSSSELGCYSNVCLQVQKLGKYSYTIYHTPLKKSLKVYSIYLLSPSHRKKLKVFSSEYLSEAKKELIRISEEYNKPIVRYSPRISEKTRMRKR